MCKLLLDITHRRSNVSSKGDKMNNNKEGLGKVVAYCRVSTEGQKEEGTIELQVDAIKEFVSSMPETELVEVFKDEGVSGGLGDRPALAELYDYVYNSDNNVKTVIIYKLDRLARDIIIQETIIRDLENKGVSVISTKEALDGFDKGTREMVRGMFGLIAQYEKWVITMRLRGGRRRKARRGGFAGSRVALGYSSIERELKKNTDESDIIRKIYLMKKNKLSMNEIARRLNAEGLKTKTSTGRWYPSTVSYILKNNLYKGMYQYIDDECAREDLALVGRFA